MLVLDNNAIDKVALCIWTHEIANPNDFIEISSKYLLYSLAQNNNKYCPER